MSELERAVRALRRRMTLSRAAEAAIRWGFFASLAAFAALTASLFGGVPIPAAAAAAFVAAVASIGALAARKPSAVEIDRALGLDERLATAMEARPGPLAELQRADAVRALAGADRRRASRFVLSMEGRLLPLMLALGAGAALAQGLRPPDEPPAAGTHVEAMQWIASARAPATDATADLDRRLAKLADAIADGAAPIDELVALSRDAQDRLRRDPSLTADQARRLKEIGRAASGAAASLARDSSAQATLNWASGDDPLLREAFGDAGQRHAAARPDAAEITVHPAGRPLGGLSADGSAAAPRLWDRSYDATLRRYFSLQE